MNETSWAKKHSKWLQGFSHGFGPLGKIALAPGIYADFGPFRGFPCLKLGVTDSGMGNQVQDGLLKAGIATAQKHLFLCIGPDCCAPAQGEALWEYLKKRVRELGIPVMRTKAGCFRICAGGPWLVVYPDGVWYGELDTERLERILTEHVMGGHPVSEWIAAQNSLGCASAAPNQ